MNELTFTASTNPTLESKLQFFLNRFYISVVCESCHGIGWNQNREHPEICAVCRGRGKLQTLFRLRIRKERVQDDLAAIPSGYKRWILRNPEGKRRKERKYKKKYRQTPKYKAYARQYMQTYYRRHHQPKRISIDKDI